jgi:hypothetical protein
MSCGLLTLSLIKIADAQNRDEMAAFDASAVRVFSG